MQIDPNRRPLSAVEPEQGEQPGDWYWTSVIRRANVECRSSTVRLQPSSGWSEEGGDKRSGSLDRIGLCLDRSGGRVGR